MKIERIRGLRLEAPRAGGELYPLDDLRHARHNRWFSNGATCTVERCLSDIALRIDGPHDDQVALDSRVVRQGSVVTGTSFINMRLYDRSDVVDSASWVVRVSRLGRGRRVG